MIRIMLVDDHQMWREGLRSMIERESGMTVVAEAGSGQDAVELVQKHRPNVVVMDISMPGMSGLAAARAVLKLDPSIRVIVLTGHPEKAYLKEVLRAGASGFLLKESAFAELIKAIRAVREGGQYLSKATLASITASVPPAVPSLSLLSARETDVLRLMAGGLLAKEIAATLGIGGKTVETHQHRMMLKVGVSGVEALTKLAVSAGFGSDAQVRPRA
jgi:DNA-binding NarL/FixJ family response regulator